MPDASARSKQQPFRRSVGVEWWEGDSSAEKMKLFWTAAAITWIDVFPSAIKPSLITSPWLSIGNFHLITTNMVSYLNPKVQPSGSDCAEIYVCFFRDSSGTLCHFYIPSVERSVDFLFNHIIEHCASSGFQFKSFLVVKCDGVRNGRLQLYNFLILSCIID